jgi:hypothetical protein
MSDPQRTVRGVGAAALVLEAVVMFLAIVPLAKLDSPHKAASIIVVLTLMVLCCVLAGLLRYRWAWYAGIALQVVLFAAGLLNGALFVLGLVFGGVWAYVLNVRRTVLR